jgi:hypothetical protein
MKRPSDREVGAKIRGAMEATRAGQILLVDPSVIETDLLDMDFLIEDLPGILKRILEEIAPKCYVGARPPQKSYKANITGCELFAFQWQSGTFGRAMYFKFALKDGFVWIVSLHQDRPKERG